MASAEIWASLLTAVDPLSVRAMPAMLQSTIDLLETELARARAALQELQSQPEPCYVTLQNDVTGEAMAAYRTHLLERVAASSSLSLPQSQTELRRGSGLRIKRKVSFWDIISNSLILDNLAPYLSVASLFSLASTCTALRAVIMDTPYVFRYLDLTDCKGAQLSWMPAIHGNMSAARMMEQPAEDEQLYSAPLRTIFDDLNRRSVLQDVRTLILDGLPVTAELVSDILLTDRFRISLLSIRGCLYLDDHKLRQAIEYAAEEPGNRSGVLANRPGCLSLGSEWYRQSGQVLKLPSVQNGWAHTLQLCQGVISFDAPLCRGARHDPNLYLMNNNNNESHQQYHQATNSQFQHPQGDIALSVTAAASGPLLPPAIATVSLGPAGCDGCRTSPEGPLVWQQSPEQHFPLLTPPPLHSYKTAVAKAPALRLDESPVLIAQCEECLRGRRCHRCNRWMCAACLPDTTKPWPPKHQNRPFMRRDCWECGPTCLSCMMEVLRSCDACGGEYCIDHNDGCSPTKCDWCNTTTPRRMIRGLH
ncbi:hypothetical protein TEQG_04187 [Trichophyton equinum CBS 127.97]|uniref:F-box domain-containing protein n=1 Tax=Trichophyton equinum (strain ATCC MYA-4606 / CBS 127.97) TaxID=559882 RepID=F2PTF1_TRIEC|nr:hypothetical protein TEQG_04187 [Trichophyton equinum CBS 127.97]